MDLRQDLRKNELDEELREGTRLRSFSLGSFTNLTALTITAEAAAFTRMIAS
jgi:hypothetical protein